VILDLYQGFYPGASGCGPATASWHGLVHEHGLCMSRRAATGGCRLLVVSYNLSSSRQPHFYAIIHLTCTSALRPDYCCRDFGGVIYRYGQRCEQAWRDTAHRRPDDGESLLRSHARVSVPGQCVTVGPAVRGLDSAGQQTGGTLSVTVGTLRLSCHEVVVPGRRRAAASVPGSADGYRDGGPSASGWTRR
jgi:hypothetical protein